MQVHSRKHPAPAANSVWPQGRPGVKNTLSSTTANSSAATALSTRSVQGMRPSEAGTNWNRHTSRHKKASGSTRPGSALPNFWRRTPKPVRARQPYTSSHAPASTGVMTSAQAVQAGVVAYSSG